jgi:hypothetical protein
MALPGVSYTVPNISNQVKLVSAEEGILLARDWGFPRPIEEYEHWGHWFTYKNRLVWWVNRVMTTDLDPVFEIHIAVDPKWRRRIPMHKLLKHTENFVGERCGRQGALIVGRPCEGIEPYLGRLGFTFSDRTQVWYKIFGDSNG